MKARPHLLLVEDEPTSRAFLAAALRGLPAHVHTAASGAEALALARTHRYACWLIDAHLPDGCGIDVHAALRATGADTVALAHTASPDRDLHARLRAAGFADVLVKPLPADTLRRTVRAALEPGRRRPGATHAGQPGTADDDAALWDLDAAMRAVGGNPAHLRALRMLFLIELPGVESRIRDAVEHADAAALQAELHRLHASCGFVGAARIGSAARALGSDPGPARLGEFASAVRETLATR